MPAEPPASDRGTLSHRPAVTAFHEDGASSALPRMNHLHECQPLLPFSAERDRSISIDACVPWCVLLGSSAGTVEFAGGDAVAVDAIIFCTGYLYTGMLPPPPPPHPHHSPPPSLFLSNTHARTRTHSTRHPAATVSPADTFPCNRNGPLAGRRGRDTARSAISVN